jgi:asparagine synthase (glutamine-hydrolysing)
MCGILFTNNPGITKADFCNALNLMIHRGPDIPPNNYSYRLFQLGHTRLKILDLDNRSNQPFISEDDRYVMVYNGEIYNYKELAKNFNLILKTTGDTEVLLKLYVKLGSQMLNHLNGMFSVVILDKLTNQFFAARDRLGIKPLYYSELNGTYIFSSEIAPILMMTHNNEFDPIGIRQYKKLRTFFNGRTIYSSIKMFPAGHFMENEKLQTYWELPLYDKPAPDDDELYELVKSSVNYRCISDVPVGTYLSGGLDSTIITAITKKYIDSFYTWTVGFKDENEFEYSDQAAKHFNTIHTKVLVNENEFVSTAKTLILKRQEPLSVPNEVLLYIMTKEVKRFNTVVLSGEGADELFFGYDRIFRWADNSNWNLEQFSKLYSYGSHDDLEIIEDAVSPFLKYKTVIDIVAAFFQVAHLHGLLRRLDNATMFNSVEARVPFVDYRLVERMAGVSFDYKMKNGVVKQPLKKIFKYEIPQTIMQREKIGFPVPLSQMDFGIKSKESPMDKWFSFNLSVLGISEEVIIEH